jgi:hypothetical protein
MPPQRRGLVHNRSGDAPRRGPAGVRPGGLTGGGAEGLFEGRTGALILTGVLAAFVGVGVGTRLVSKVTMHTVQTLTGGLLLLIALALGAGLI